MPQNICVLPQKVPLELEDVYCFSAHIYSFIKYIVIKAGFTQNIFFVVKDFVATWFTGFPGKHITL